MPEESPLPAAKLRESSRCVEVYTEGLWVFLYDESHTALLVEERALEILDGNQTKAKQQRELARRGLIAIYELDQDDPIRVEIDVGPPLSAREKKSARWLKPQKAFLSLPSGRLRIDSANTLPFGDTPPEDRNDEYAKGAQIEVPKGDYVVTLHRVDWDEMEEREDGPGLPREFISLTSTEDMKPPKKLEPILTWDAAVGKEQLWLRDWKIEEGVFQGRVGRAGARSLLTNLQPQAIKQLGLRWGAKIRLSGENWQREAVYLGYMNTHYLAMIYGPEGEGLGGGGESANRNEVDVVLTGFSQNKIGVIQAVKQITGASLVDAKTMVEACPVTLKESVVKHEAEEMLAKIEKAGGTVEWASRQPRRFAHLTGIDSRGKVAVELWSEDIPTAAEGTAVSIRRLDETHAPPPDASLRGKTSVDGGVLNAFALAASPRAVVLNFGSAELGEIPSGHENPLRLRADDANREIFLQSEDTRDAFHAAMLELLSATPEGERLQQRIEKRMGQSADEHSWAMSLGDELRNADARLARSGFEFPDDILARMPLFGTVMQDWEVDGAEVFVLVPICGVATGLSIAPGTPVTIGRR